MGYQGETMRKVSGHNKWGERVKNIMPLIQKYQLRYSY